MSPPPVARTVVFHPHEARAQFAFRMRSPAFSAVRLVVPHRAIVSLLAKPAGSGGMELVFSTRPFRGRCRRRGRVDVCETDEEACPAPHGRWIVRVTRHGRTNAPMRVRVRLTFSNRAG